jgi:hypothetical protein
MADAGRDDLIVPPRFHIHSRSLRPVFSHDFPAGSWFNPPKIIMRAGGSE